MKRLFIIASAILALGAGCAKPQYAPAPPSGPIGGAVIETPFRRVVAGAQCFVGSGNNSDKAAFGFPSRDLTAAPLVFSLGPLTDGYSPGQEKNRKYEGPGVYDNIGIVVRKESGEPLIGYGTITVNADRKTGSFRFSDGSASGTWDCGFPLQ